MTKAQRRSIQTPAPVSWTLAFLLSLSSVVVVGCSAPESEPEAEVQAPAEILQTPGTQRPGPKPLWQQHIDELQPEVEAWARAWSDQDVDAYLSYYSEDFSPPNSVTLEAWRSQRRQRIERPSRIRVTLSNFRRVGFNKFSTGTRQLELVQVRFLQAYESNTFSDEVEKELQLELVDLTWKIFSETSL